MTTWSLEKRTAAAVRSALRRVLAYDDTEVVERPGWYQLVTPSAPRGVLNEIAWSEVEEADAERVIDEAIERYRRIAQPVKWCVGPWTRPADFGERLTARGFTHWDVRGQGSPTESPIATPHDVTVVEVDEASLEEHVAISDEGWATASGGLTHAACRRALHATPRSAFFFTARLEGEPVGTGAIQLVDDSGYLFRSQVLERARGRGVYRALVAARLAFLNARGVRYAVTQAREHTSAPMLEHLGFETLFRSKCYWLE